MEMINGLAQVYAQGGTSLLVIIGFFILVIWVMKQSDEREKTMRKDNKEREDKLYVTIEILSKDLPEIKEQITKMNANIKELVIKK